MTNPLLAYLDQTHLGQMSDAQFNQLLALVDAGRLLIPSSDIHTIETIKQSTAHRPTTLGRISRLRARRILHDEGLVMVIEWLAHRGALVVRDALVATKPGDDAEWHGAPADALELAAEHLDDQVGANLTQQVGEHFGGLADQLAQLRAIPLHDVRENVAAALGILGVEPAPAASELPDTEDEFADVFPSIGLRRRFYANATSLEVNDIADLSFICRTVPYFDVVAVDRKMHDRLHALQRRLPTRLASRLFRARIVRDLDQAVAAICELAAR